MCDFSSGILESWFVSVWEFMELFSTISNSSKLWKNIWNALTLLKDKLCLIPQHHNHSIFFLLSLCSPHHIEGQGRSKLARKNPELWRRSWDATTFISAHRNKFKRSFEFDDFEKHFIIGCHESRKARNFQPCKVSTIGSGTLENYTNVMSPFRMEYSHKYLNYGMYVTTQSANLQLRNSDIKELG